MRSYGTAFALLSLGLLSGCTGTHAVTAAESAPTTAPQHSVNRYELHGSPDKIALLVDSETGNVWRYRADAGGESFIPVSMEGQKQPAPEAIQEYVWGPDRKLHPKGDVHPPLGMEFDRNGHAVQSKP